MTRLIPIILIAALLGCEFPPRPATPGTAHVHHMIPATAPGTGPDHAAAEELTQPGPSVTDVSATQSSDPAGPMTIEVTPAGVRLTVGAAQMPPKPDAGVAAMQPVTKAGIGLCILAAVLLVVRVWVPLIPLLGVIAVGALGGVLCVLPVLADRYSGWMMLGMAGVGVVVIVWQGWRLGWFKKEVGPATQAKLLAKGDTRAAGALASIDQGKDAAKVVAATRVTREVVSN